MFNKSEKEERQYLDKTRKKLKSALEQIDRSVDNYARELKEQKDYLWENKAGWIKAEMICLNSRTITLLK